MGTALEGTDIMPTKLLLLLLLLAPSLTNAASRPDVETMLVPIVTNGVSVPGAYGTLWTTQLWVDNRTDAAMQFQQPLPGGGGFPPGAVTTQPGYLGPLALDEFHPSGGGALLATHVTLAPDVYLWNRFVELTRRADPLGVAVPVVRERDFFTAESEFLAIPAGAGVRSAIRAYDPLRDRIAPLIVEVLSASGTVLSTLTLNPGGDPVLADPYRMYIPGYDAILDVAAVVPQIDDGELYHVRIRPQVPGSIYWAMVSVTDNETQQVLIVTSHKK